MAPLELEGSDAPWNFLICLSLELELLAGASPVFARSVHRQHVSSQVVQRGVVRRTNEVVKLRLTMGLTAARRAAAIAERWMNMASSIEL